MSSSHTWKMASFLLSLCCLVTSLPTEGSYRLPLEVIPHSYKIQLVPYLDEGDTTRQFTFDGNVSILVRAQRPESSITLHMVDMQLHGLPTVVEEYTGKFINVANVTTDTARDFLILHLANPLVERGIYRLNISYTGNLQTNMKGFFRAYYYVGNTKRWLAATQFEPLHARKSFPCFDEPALKATFNVSIGRLPNMTSISNMNILRTVGPDPSLDGRFWDIYEPSAIMSTYLVAVVVSDFKALESGMYRVWSKPSSVALGAFALNLSPRIVKIMEDLIGVPYTLPKVDQVAIPEYGGGMENWGLIVYGELNLLLNLTNQMPQIAQVVAHELSHQWFGDLVTFKWWKYAWLNEGFATFFEYFVPDKIFPEWEMADSLTINEQFEIMELDSNSMNHPLTADVETPAEISTMFNGITYSKGGSVLKMLAHSITFGTFYKGLGEYLKSRAFSVSSGDDLFSSLQEAVSEDGVLPKDLTVKNIMDTWTVQVGYPVITVTRDYAAGTASIQQKQFFADCDQSSSNSSWFIPLTFTTSKELNFNNTRPGQWLAPHENLIVQNLPGEDQWIIFNIQAMGYFRINYDAQNWKLLTDQLSTDKDKIHKLNRMQLDMDSKSFAEAGLLDWDTAMGVTNYMMLETDPAPWIVAFRGLKTLFDKLSGSPAFPALQAYYLKLMDQFYKAVGFESRFGESYMVSRVRPDLLHWACLLGHEDCINSSVRTMTKMHAVSNHSLDTKVRATVYCAAVRHAGEPSWEWLWTVYRNSEDVKERQEALRALGCTSDITLLKKFLQRVITDDSGLRPEDRRNVFAATCNGHEAVSCDVTLQFIASHFGQLANLFGEYESLSTILVRIASKVRTQEQVNMLQFIINKNRQQLSVDEHLMSMAVKMAQESVDWLQTTGAGLVNWLSRQH